MRILGTLIVLAFVVVAPAQADGTVRLQWLGHAAFKLTSAQGRVILIDPFITQNPTTPPALKDISKLAPDVILVTHAHGDHVGDGPAIAARNKVPLYGPPGLNDTLTALGILDKSLSLRFNKGGTITPLGEGIRVTMTRAEHSSEFRWTNPDTGKTEVHVGGEPAGFIIELENGFTIYHMGDTGLFGDMKFIGEYYRPDVILIPIGGHFVMDPKDAAYATRHYLKPKVAIPMHYGTNPRLTATPAEYVKRLGRSKTKVMVLEPGEEVGF